MSDDTANRLQAIQTELAAVLEERLHELHQAMKQTEMVTRRILGAEIEIDRLNAGRAEMESEIRTMEGETQSARSQSEATRAQHAQRLRDRDAVRAEVAHMEREVGEIDAEVEQSRKQAAELEATAEALRRENTALKTRQKTLEENVLRMRQLQKELMSSMSDLTGQMTGLAGGDKA